MPRDGEPQEIFFSEHLYCAACDISFPDLEPNSFSFNSPLGMCPDCNGLGTRAEVDPDKLIPIQTCRSMRAPCCRGALGDEDRTAWHVEYRREALRQLKVPTNRPYRKLTARQKQLVMHGSDKRVKVSWTTTNGEGAFNTRFDGVIGWLERTIKETGSEGRRARLARYYADHECSTCHGQPPAARKRLGPTLRSLAARRLHPDDRRGARFFCPTEPDSGTITDRRGSLARGQRPPAILGQCGSRLPHPGPLWANAVWWRSTADPFGLSRSVRN